MKPINVFATLTTALAMILLSACNMPQTQIAPTQTPDVPPAASIQYKFVTNKLLIPTTDDQVKAYSLNVDGDPQQNLDNKVGELLALISSAVSGLEMQSTIDQTVNAGQLISLHLIKSDDPMNSQAVSWLLIQGQRTSSAPAFDGSDNFTTDASVPINPAVVGTLTNGHFSGGPGVLRVQVFLMGQRVDLDLIGVRIEADVSAKGCANGKLAGALSVDEFRAKLLPFIVDGLNLVIKTDQDVANILLPMFDSDHNKTIATEELEANPILKLALAPDLDLLDASGKFNPRQDGVKDSYSMGLGFTCAPANFTAPGE